MHIDIGDFRARAQRRQDNHRVGTGRESQQVPGQKIGHGLARRYLLSIPLQDGDPLGREHRLNLHDTGSLERRPKAQENRTRFAVKRGATAPADAKILLELDFEDWSIGSGNGWIARTDARRSPTAGDDTYRENCTFQV